MKPSTRAHRTRTRPACHTHEGIPSGPPGVGPAGFDPQELCPGLVGAAVCSVQGTRRKSPRCPQKPPFLAAPTPALEVGVASTGSYWPWRGASPVPPPPEGRLTLTPGLCAEAPACPGHVAVSRNWAFTGKASPSQPAPAQPAPRAAVMPRGGQHPGMTLPARRGTTCPHGGRSSPAHTVLADASLRDCERMTLALKPLGLCSGDSAWGTRI